MRRPADRRRARIAAIASAGLHLAAAVALLPTLRAPTRPAAPPGRDWAIVVPPEREPTPAEHRVPPVTSPPPAEAEAPAEAAPPTPPQPSAEPTGLPPTVAAVPSPLPAAVRQWMRERERAPKLEPVQDMIDVRHAVHAESSPVAPAAPQVAAATPGATPPVDRVTAAFVLDASGTMGRHGRLGRARAALLAAFDRLGSESKAVVVVYTRRAQPLLPGGPLPATAATRGRIESALMALQPAGESGHAEGVRLALKFAPDQIVLFTDAAEEELAAVPALLRGAGRPVRFGVARAE